jgi:hypothetical protein
MNSTLMGMVRCFVQADHLGWDEFIPQLAAAIKATPNRSTGFSPNMMMLGREVMVPSDIIFSLPDEVRGEPAAYLLKLQDRLAEVRDVARKHLKVSQASQKRTYDLKAFQNSYEPGDVVLVLNTASSPGVSSKLKPLWKGPFLVEKVLTPVLYRLRDYRKSITLHHDRLKPCRDRVVPIWLRRLRRQLLNEGNDHAQPRQPPKPKKTTPLNDEPLEDIRFLFEEQPSAEPLVPPGRQTRAGRNIVTPHHLRDFLI